MLLKWFDRPATPQDVDMVTMIGVRTHQYDAKKVVPIKEAAQRTYRRA